MKIKPHKFSLKKRSSAIKNQWQKLLLALLCYFPVGAYAGLSGGSDDTVTTIIYNLCNWLSGTPAVAVGILAVAYSGYEMLEGQIEKRTLITRCVAIGLIIGSTYIGKEIIMKGIN